MGEKLSPDSVEGKELLVVAELVDRALSHAEQLNGLIRILADHGVKTDVSIQDVTLIQDTISIPRVDPWFTKT